MSSDDDTRSLVSDSGTVTDHLPDPTTDINAPDGLLSELPSVETYTAEIEALSAVHSGSDTSTGNTAQLRREKMTTPSGDIVAVPLITGNSIKGQLRDLLAHDFFRRVGYNIRDHRLFHMFFSGGALEAGGDQPGALGIRQRKILREVFPPINLLGTAYETEMLESPANVEDMLPACFENAGRIGLSESRDVSAFVDTTFGTRRDDSPDDVAPDVSDLDFEVGADGDNGGSGDNDNDNATGPQSMIYNFEVMVRGTRFEHRFKLDSRARRLDRACLAHAIRLWQSRGTVGAKASVGWGRIGWGDGYSSDSADHSETGQLDLSEADDYVAFVNENAQLIRDTLDEFSRK